jgi:hypothetical protein
MARRSHIASILLVAAAALPLLPPAVRPVAGQVPEGYEVLRFTQDSLDDRFFRLNNRGQIVWTRRLGAGPETQKIFFWDHGRVRQLTTDNEAEVTSDLNDDGVIVWTSRGAVGGTIRQWHNGTITTISDMAINGQPRINAHGVIAWYAFTGQGCDGNEIIVRRDGQNEVITQDIRLKQTLNLNVHGQMVWASYDFCQNPWVSRIEFYDGQSVIVVSDLEQVQVQVPFLNDNGQITWRGGNGRIYHWESGQLTVYPEYLISSVTISNRGQAAYTAQLSPESPRGLYLEFDGDRYFITDLGGGTRRINDRGELLFNIGTFPDDIGMLRRITMTGDISGDADVDLDDFAILQLCFAPDAPITIPGCRTADLNKDDLVDASDYTILSSVLLGPRHPADADYDGRIDLRDYVRLQQCISDPARVIRPGCWSCDANADNHVNGEDADLVAGRMTGPAAAGQ